MSFFSLFLHVLSALLTETQHLQALLPSVLLGVGREDVSSKIWQCGNTIILWGFGGGVGRGFATNLRSYLHPCLGLLKCKAICCN